MRSKADETFVIVETLICPLQNSLSFDLSSTFILINEITLRSPFVVAFRQPWLLIFVWPFPHLPFLDGNEARTNLTRDHRP